MDWYRKEAPTFPNIWSKYGPRRGKNITFKTPRELMKRLFVEIMKQIRRMKMQKTLYFKPVRAGLKTLKRGPVPH